MKTSAGPGVSYRVTSRLVITLFRRSTKTMVCSGRHEDRFDIPGVRREPGSFVFESVMSADLHSGI